MSFDSRAFNATLRKIKSILRRQDAVALLNKIIYSDVAQSQRQIGGYDAISRKELSFLIGLLLKNSDYADPAIPLRKGSSHTIKRLRKLLQRLHFEILMSGRNDHDSSHQDRCYFNSETLVESTFYEEAGFYNDQPVRLITELYRYDKEWVRDNMGFELSALQAFYFAVCSVIVHKHERALKAGKKYGMDNFFNIHDIMTEANDMSIEKGVTLDDKTIRSILDIFSCRPGAQLPSFSRPGDENILSYYPIVDFGDDRYWLPLTGLLASALYSSPLHWMRQDDTYKNTANKHIGIALEEICRDLLARVFDDTNDSVVIYNGKNRYTDIDASAFYDGAAIIVQAKNKRMMPQTLSGNLVSLKRDFLIAVQEAYNQGKKAARALAEPDSYKFVNKDGHEIETPKVDNTFILCVTSGVYYSGAIQVHQYLEQKNDDAAELPIVFSIFDLDLITRYLTNPSEFIFYLRLRVEKYRNLINNNEVAPLSAYLFSDVLHNTKLGYTALLGDVISTLDEDYMENTWCHFPQFNKQFSIRYASAPHFVELLNIVYNAQVTGKQLVLFRLLSLYRNEAKQISEKIAQCSLNVLREQNCGFSVIFEDFGLSYFNSSLIDDSELLDRMTMNAGYCRKDAWIGFLYDRVTRTTIFRYIER